jgi:dGTP triphosphohydrolase
MVSDLIEETRRRLDGAKPQSVDDIRRLGGPVVAFSDSMRDKERALKRFLFTRMYRHERVMGAAGEAKQVVRRSSTPISPSPSFCPRNGGPMRRPLIRRKPRAWWRTISPG